MTEFNPKFLFFVFLIIGFIGLMGYTHFQKVEAEKAQIILDEQNKLIEQSKHDSMVVITTPEPEPTGTPYLMYSPPPVRVDNSMDIGKFFNWKAENVSGFKDINVSSTIYGYKEFKNFSYYDYNWGKVFNEYAPEGKEYFMVYIYTYMDETGVTVYLPQQTNYGLLINDIMYYPIVFDYERNQIKEMDEIYNYNHVERIKPYAYEYIRANDEITGVEKPIMSPLQYLRPGKSNAEDGYIIFEIPENYNKRMLRLHANFFSFGSASWKIM